MLCWDKLLVVPYFTAKVVWTRGLKHEILLSNWGTRIHPKHFIKTFLRPSHSICGPVRRQDDCGQCANCIYGTKVLDGRPHLDSILGPHLPAPSYSQLSCCHFMSLHVTSHPWGLWPVMTRISRPWPWSVSSVLALWCKSLTFSDLAHDFNICYFRIHSNCLL